jgi:hypothetical protein
LEVRGEEYQKFRTQPEKLEGWIKAGDYEINSKVSDAELGANAVVASTIINADATIIKR